MNTILYGSIHFINSGTHTVLQLAAKYIILKVHKPHKRFFLLKWGRFYALQVTLFSFTRQNRKRIHYQQNVVCQPRSAIFTLLFAHNSSHESLLCRKHFFLFFFGCGSRYFGGTSTKPIHYEYKEQPKKIYRSDSLDKDFQFGSVFSPKFFFQLCWLPQPCTHARQKGELWISPGAI